MFNTLALLIFPVLMAFAAASDLLTMRISNRLILAVVVGFAVIALAMAMPWPSLGWHLAAGLVVLAVTFTFFSLGWIGGGDAKLAAATALWFGFGEMLVAYLLYAGLLGGVLTVFILLARKVPLPATLSDVPWVARLHDAGTGIPYGIALAAAALLVYPRTPIFMHFGV